MTFRRPSLPSNLGTGVFPFFFLQAVFQFDFSCFFRTGVKAHSSGRALSLFPPGLIRSPFFLGSFPLFPNLVMSGAKRIIHSLAWKQLFSSPTKIITLYLPSRFVASLNAWRVNFSFCRGRIFFLCPVSLLFIWVFLGLERRVVSCSFGRYFFSFFLDMCFSPPPFILARHRNLLPATDTSPLSPQSPPPSPFPTCAKVIWISGLRIAGFASPSVMSFLFFCFRRVGPSPLFFSKPWVG